MTLHAATRLATNTIPILHEIITGLRADGFDIEVDQTDSLGEPDLLFACGLLTVQMIDADAPYSIVAAPIFPGETEPVYRSVIIARSSSTDEVMAVNEYGSWSGWHGYLADGRPSPRDVVLTGAHVDSVAAVVAGDADFAAIDSSIWNDLVARDEVGEEIVVVGETRDYPAPPLSLHDRVCGAERAGLIDALCSLAGVRPIGVDAYESMRSAGGS